ncbi:phosphoribosylaminoimidazolesuccinocarboxamide synthase [Paenibacillus sp. GCM10027626]|uniref:phosphoribosylaminoimidazolesuccinocarboxamide synthase n=1 Tax=Paenibacillus sp. GCM10027626 TaxID=3273411 RepID=UPI003632A27D
MTQALTTAARLIKSPLLYKGKVRELYDLGEHMLIVVTDRISAYDYVLEPAVPGKGIILNQMSLAWFELSKQIMPNHIVHTDIDQLGPLVEDKDALRNRIMVVKKAERLPVECVVRGYLAGDGWRQYAATGMINGHKLPAGLRKNERLGNPIFTPAKKNDVGHDENISFAEMSGWLGEELTRQLETLSLALYQLGNEYCEQRGILLADTKFEFGRVGDDIVLIDELFTPDSSRFWHKDKYALDIEIESLDKEPVRKYLAGSGWDRNSPPAPLPAPVVAATAERYKEIAELLFK